MFSSIELFRSRVRQLGIKIQQQLVLYRQAILAGGDPSELYPFDDNSEFFAYDADFNLEGKGAEQEEDHGFYDSYRLESNRSIVALGTRTVSKSSNGWTKYIKSTTMFTSSWPLTRMAGISWRYMSTSM